MGEDVRSAFTNAVISANVKNTGELQKVINAFVPLVGWGDIGKILSSYKTSLLEKVKNKELAEIYNVTEKKEDVAEKKESKTAKQMSALEESIKNINKWTVRP